MIPTLNMPSFTCKPFTFVLLVHSGIKEALLCHAVPQPWHQDPEAVGSPPYGPPAPRHEAGLPALGVPVEAGETKSLHPQTTGHLGPQTALQTAHSIPTHQSPIACCPGLCPFGCGTFPGTEIPRPCWAASEVLTHPHRWERDQ